MDESVLVTLARVAERAERYDEMADFMKQRVEVGSALNPEERDMFSAAFKNSLTERRHAVRVAAGVEQMEQAEGRDAYASLAGGYRSKMEAELQEICSNALALLGSLVSSAEPGEAKTFFLKMQGDYYRHSDALPGYLAEWTTGPAKSEVAGQAMNVYKQGMGEAMSLPTAHPAAWRVLLRSLPVPPQDTDSAVATATEALNAASAGIEDIPEESRNDARRREGEVSPRKLSSDTGGLMDSMTMPKWIEQTTWSWSLSSVRAFVPQSIEIEDGLI
ncbi:unnamed protein product [Durusdinium trenchii]